MDWSDADVLTLLLDQIDEVAGDSIDLPEAAADILVRAINRARATRDDADAVRAFGVLWDYPLLRRQPWQQGVRSYLAWRLHGNRERAAASLLCADVLSTPSIADLCGRTEHELWIPAAAARLIVEDLEMMADGTGPLDAFLPPPGPARDWVPLMLEAIAEGPVARTWIQSTDYWTIIPGWALTIPSDRRPPPALAALLSCYRRRPGSARTILVAPGTEVLGCYGNQDLPPLRSQPTIIREQVLAIHGPEASRDIGLTRMLLQAIPPSHRWLVLCLPEQTVRLTDAFRAFLVDCLGRYIRCGLYPDPRGGDTGYWCLQQPAPPWERACLHATPDGGLALSAGIVPSLLTDLRLIPEGLGERLTPGHRWLSPSWEDLTGPWGMGSLLREAFPHRAPPSQFPDAPWQTEWLVLPPALATLLMASLQKDSQ